jgi:hypothetical protein
VVCRSMQFIKLKGLKRYSKGGREYCYHRATGICLSPPHEFGSQEFVAAYLEAEAKLKASQEPSLKPQGTWGRLVQEYKESPRFTNLKRRTKADYELYLGRISRTMDGVRLEKIDAFSLAKLRNHVEKNRGWRAANYTLQVISVVLSHGQEIGHTKTNPAKDVKRAKRPTSLPRANRPWTDEEFQAVVEAAPPHLLVPIAIARWTSLREGDVLTLKRPAYHEGVITHVTEKTSQPVEHPCPKPLKEILDAMPRHSAVTLCVNSRGTPWTSDGFRTSFFRLIRGLEKEGKVGSRLTFHGLRTTVLQESADKGFTALQIAGYAGHKSPRSTERYIADRDRKAGIAEISASMDETNSDQKLSTKVSTWTIPQPRGRLSG